MRILLFVLLMSTMSFAVNLDSLNQDVTQQKPAQMIIGKVGSFFINKMKSDDVKSKGVLTPPDELFGRRDEVSVRRYSGMYVTIREYDKDLKRFEDKVNEIKSDNEKIASILAVQSENSKSTVKSQEFILNLITGLAALFTAAGGVIGAVKILSKRKGKVITG